MTAPTAVKLGVLISGSGTNLQAIIEAIEGGGLNAQIRIVISNRPDVPGLARAERHRIESRVIDHRQFTRREDFDRQLVAVLRDREVELVVCAGFDRLLSPVMLEAYPLRTMNIHPALSPAFPGLRAQKAALDYGVRFTGCSVFFVTPEMDQGPVIVQAVVPVYPDDDEELLTQRILAQEHRIYPYAIRLFQQGRLEVRGRTVIVKDEPSAAALPPLINPPLD